MKISIKIVNYKNRINQTSKSKNKENKKDRFQVLQLKYTPSVANIFAKVFHLKRTSLSLDEHVILIGR